MCDAPRKKAETMIEFICIIALGFVTIYSDTVLGRMVIVEKIAAISV